MKWNFWYSEISENLKYYVKKYQCAISQTFAYVDIVLCLSLCLKTIYGIIDWISVFIHFSDIIKIKKNISDNNKKTKKCNILIIHMGKALFILPNFPFS